LRNRWCHGLDATHEQQHDRPEDTAAECNSSKIDRAVLASHDGVRDAHAHLRELRTHEGQGQAK